MNEQTQYIVGGGLFIGCFLLFLYMGKIPGSQHSPDYYREDSPVAYWGLQAVFLIIGIGCLLKGL